VACGAALFAAVHFEPVKLPGTILIALLFGWWFVQLRSIWPGVFGHALNNSVAVLGLLIDPGATQPMVPEFSWVEPVAATVGALMLAGGVLMLRRKFQATAIEQVAVATV
jgi:membrane protease YdiL (CAAX protease family)